MPCAECASREDSPESQINLKASTDYMDEKRMTQIKSDC